MPFVARPLSVYAEFAPTAYRPPPPPPPPPQLAVAQVVTKTVNQPDVYEFVMDESEFERRAETNSAMFRDNIKLRNAGKGKEEVKKRGRGGGGLWVLSLCCCCCSVGCLWGGGRGG